jgi:hypothetical protein
VDGYVWFKGTEKGVAVERMFKPGEAVIERDPTPAASQVPAPMPIVPGAPKAAVITLGDEDNGDMVGVYITADALRKMIPMLEEELGKDKSSLVVLRVHSAGGLFSEVQPISDVIHDEYQTRWRVVAWIETAISSGADAVHGIREIYFTPQGNYGAAGCTWGCMPINHESLERQLEVMKQQSARGNHDPLIMRSMQIQAPLSATVDPSGAVHWFPDATSGEILVNRPNEILTFNCKTAEIVHFSKGTADALHQLVAAMGSKDLNWIGDPVKDVAWPVCRAERWNIDHRKELHADKDVCQKLIQSFNGHIAAASGLAQPDRARTVELARSDLATLKTLVEKRRGFSFMAFGMSPAEFTEFAIEQEKRLDKLSK